MTGASCGAVGRLVDVKDHARLIDAVHLLRGRGQRVLAVIAGEGPLRGGLEARIARLGLERAEFLRLIHYWERMMLAAASARE